MTNQEKIRYLRQYRMAGLEVKRLEGELLRWRSQAERVTASTSQATRSSGDDRLQCAVERMEVLRSQLAAQLEQRVLCRQDIDRTIASVDDARLQQLLRYRYIDGWTWEKIAAEMNYAYRQVTRLHGQAISHISKDVLVLPT